MTTVEKLQVAFPALKEDGSWLEGAPSYRELVESLGHDVLVEVTDSDYQGDSRFLLRAKAGDGAGVRFGYLKFGWGSCSGCDSLEAARTVADLASLSDELESGISWFDGPAAALKFLRERDWEATEWGVKQCLKFAGEATAALEATP